MLLHLAPAPKPTRVQVAEHREASDGPWHAKGEQLGCEPAQIDAVEGLAQVDVDLSASHLGSPRRLGNQSVAPSELDGRRDLRQARLDLGEEGAPQPAPNADDGGEDADGANAAAIGLWDERDGCARSARGPAAEAL